jgi:hypothetical protein
VPYRTRKGITNAKRAQTGSNKDTSDDLRWRLTKLRNWSSCERFSFFFLRML